MSPFQLRQAPANLQKNCLSSSPTQIADFCNKIGTFAKCQAPTDNSEDDGKADHLAPTPQDRV